MLHCGEAAAKLITRPPLVVHYFARVCWLATSLRRRRGGGGGGGGRCDDNAASLWFMLTLTFK